VYGEPKPKRGLENWMELRRGWQRGRGHGRAKCPEETVCEGITVRVGEGMGYIY
jgi:hypothetical protein